MILVLLNQCNYLECMEDTVLREIKEREEVIGEFMSISTEIKKNNIKDLRRLDLLNLEQTRPHKVNTKQQP